MATWVVFHEFKKYVGDGTIDLDSHSFKAMLTNVAPNAGTNTVKADITEISAGNGYSAGGVALTSVTWLETGGGTGIWRFDCDNFSWTASGGAIAQFRYIVMYDDTAASDQLVCYLDNGAAVDVANGNTFQVTVAADGVFELS